MIASNGRSDKAIAKKDLFVFWGISVEIPVLQPGKGQIKDTRKFRFFKAIVFPGRAFMVVQAFCQDVLVLMF